MVVGGHPTLRTKLRRDIARQWPQFAAIAVTVLLGVGLFAASYDAYRNLRDSYDGVFADQRFADLFVTTDDADRFAATARATDGVAAVATRTQADVPLAVDSDKLRGRVVGYPRDGQPAVNRLTLLSGGWLEQPDDALVEQHMAEHFGLSAGDTVMATGPDGWQALRVVGVVSSGEYLWPARSRQDPISTPDDFGVLFVPEATAQHLAGRTTPGQVLIRLTDAARGSRVLDMLARQAVVAGATTVLTRAEQPSNALLQEDIDGFQELAVAFPLLFLSAAGLSTYVLLARRVQSERTLIGVLRAHAMRRRTVAGHYLAYGLSAGLVGAVFGVALGMWGATLLSRMYVQIIDLPTQSQQITLVRPITLIGGLAYGLVVGALATLGPALLASRVPPAEAMRPVAPQTNGKSSLLERLLPGTRLIPARWRMALRGIARNRRRTTFTATGVALALVLVLVSWTMIDTMSSLLRTQFDVVAKQDAEVTLTQPADPAQLTDLREVPGVAAAEPLVRQPVTLVSGNRSYATVLRGLERGTTMHGFRPAEGPASSLPDAGILVGRAVRDRLGIGAGDEVSLRFPAIGRTERVQIVGLLDEPLGTYAYASIDWLRSTLGDVPAMSALLRFDPGADPAAVERVLSARGDVAAYTDSQALARLWDDYAGLFYVFVGGMLVLGGLMAFGIIFTTMSVNITERRREMATLRAVGVRHSQMARLVAGENLFVAALGVGPGLVLGVVLGKIFLDSFSSDQFRLSLVVLPSTLVLASGAILLTAALSQWPGLRAVRRMDIAQIVREGGG